MARILEHGEHFGNAEIIKLVSRSDWVSCYVYHVRYLCCGTEATTTYENLSLRKRRNTKTCTFCAGGYRAASRGKLKAAQQIPGVYDLNGYFWPSLSYREELR